MHAGTIFFGRGKWLSSVRHDVVLGVVEGGREGADGDAHFAGNVEWCAGGSEGIEESFQGAQADAAKFHGKLWGGGAFVPRTKDAQARVVNSAELGGHGRRRVDRKTQGGESKRRRKGIVNNHGGWARLELARQSPLVLMNAEGTSAAVWPGRTVVVLRLVTAWLR